MDNTTFPVVKKVKICCIASVDISIKFLLLSQLKFLVGEGYDVYVVCSPGKWVESIIAEGVKVKTIKITRKITPLYDLVTFYRLWNYFMKEKFDIVHTNNPKPGLLGQVAAKLAGVSIIANTVHGFYFQKNSSYLKRKFFIFIEKMAAKCSDAIFFINREDMETAKNEGICNDEVIRYYGGGINIDRFDQKQFPEKFVNDKKKKLNIPMDYKVIGIVARLVEEKGYLDLFKAIELVRRIFPKTILLVVGQEEPEKKDAINSKFAEKYDIGENVIFLGERTDVEKIYALMDVFVLPSHREGLGLVVLEASAMEKPVIATDIRGCRETVDNGKTGILVPVKDPKRLADAIIYFLSNPIKAKEMGKNGRIKVAKEFDEELVFNRIKECYQELMGSKKNKKSIQRSIKRVADLICSIIGIILLFPLFLIVAIIIKMDSKGSVFFLQDRVGLSGKIFKIWKFRTMVPGAEKIGLGFSVEKNDSRITRVGVFLRRFGIDELPQLVNIIKGEMSVVGPRATLVHQVEQYTEFEKQRLKVRPGVTNINLTKGWNTLSWKKRIEWDVWYINNWSLWMDLKILARTPFVVLSGKGQYGEAGVVEDYK